MDTLKLRKLILGIAVLAASRYETFAQSYYMHEVAEDRGYNNYGLEFLEVLQWVIIIGIGILFLVGFGIGWIKELFEGASSKTHTPQTPPNEIVSQGEFYNGWARFVTHSGKYGYIDTNGNVLKCISPGDSHFNGVQYFTEAEEFIYDVVIVKLEHWQYALIDKLGCNINKRNEKARNETYIKELENGLIYYSRRNHQHHDIFNYECYVYNRKGEMVYDGALEEIKVNKSGYLEIKNNAGYAIMTAQGKFIVPFCKKNVQLTPSLYKVFSSEGLCGVYDNSKQRMILQYRDYGNLLYIEEQNLFICSQYKFTGEEQGWSVVDINGHILFTFEADRVKVLNEKCLLVSHKDSYLQGIYSFDGKNIVPLLYDEILCSISATEFLAKKVNPKDSFDYSYTLYDINGKIANFDSYSYVEYCTMRTLKYEGTTRMISPYSSDEELKREVECPAFIKLTKKWDNNVRCCIVNMKNEIVIPADYIYIDEISNSDNFLIGFKASIPSSGDYVELDLDGNVMSKGNTLHDEQLEEYLELTIPGYQRESYRAIEENAMIDSYLDEIREREDMYNTQMEDFY